MNPQAIRNMNTNDLRSMFADRAARLHESKLSSNFFVGVGQMNWAILAQQNADCASNDLRDLTREALRRRIRKATLIRLFGALDPFYRPFAIR